MNTNNCKTCSSCGRSWPINACPAQCTCGINLRNYDYTLPACIRNKKPSCDKKAIIASTTVETTSKMEGIRDAFVHVTENNTTYYLDSCGNPIITWAGPIDMPRYDVDNNPFGYKKQLLHTVRTVTNPVTGEDEDDDVVVYYDSRGDAHVLMTEDDITRMFEYIQNEEAQIWAAIDTKQDELTAGPNIIIDKDPDTGVVTISATGSGAAYTAGANIQISPYNVISATDTTYSAGQNITISDSNAISVDEYLIAYTSGQYDPTTRSCPLTWSSTKAFNELTRNIEYINIFGDVRDSIRPSTINQGYSGGRAAIFGKFVRLSHNSQPHEVITQKYVFYEDGTGIIEDDEIQLQEKLTAGTGITIDSNNVISTDNTVSMQVVATLPTTGVSNIIYLVQRTGETVYDQWVYSEGQWYHIGDTNIDLSEYYTKLEADAKFQELLSEGNNIDPVTDSTELSSVDLSNKVVDKVAVSDLWDYMWKKIYPVGSIYTTVTNDDPATLFGGTWQIVGANRVLWGVGSGDTAGTTLAEQLPNIKGTIDFSPGSQGHAEVSVGGAFYKTANWSGTYPMPVDGSSSSGTRKVGFDANKSSSVYTDSGIVRPNAYTVKWWRRTA